MRRGVRSTESCALVTGERAAVEQPVLFELRVLRKVGLAGIETE